MADLRNFFPNEEMYNKVLSTKKTILNCSFEDEGELALTASKAGGVGYLPKSESYPVNEDGQPMSLLAQINFSEMPATPMYPETGLLAFYIDTFDDLLGLDFDDQMNTAGFRVFYFEELDAEAYSREEVAALFQVFAADERYGVVDKELKMAGELATQVLVNDSYPFEQVYGTEFYEYFEETFGDQADDQMDALFELEHTSGSRLGGYPYFTQEDPRKYAEEVTHTELLFQLDSDFGSIMWGDSGVGNFFIAKEDLLNRDFSRVMYNWDCM